MVVAGGIQKTTLRGLQCNHVELVVLESFNHVVNVNFYLIANCDDLIGVLVHSKNTIPPKKGKNELAIC